MDRHLAQARSDLERLVARGAAGELGQPQEMHRVDAVARAEYRPAAVLLLFTPTLARPDVFPGLDLYLVQRSPLLRHHPGQIALPGGRADDGDSGPAATALRETHEEIGLAPERVEVIGTLPQVAVPISRFLVTPVVGWSADPGGLEDVEVGEVLHTLRLPVSDLLDPAGRSTVTIHGHGSAGFAVQGGWVWGFTGNLLDGVFDELGWTRPWDRSREYAMSMAEARGDTLPPATPEG
ncbi:NUDIX hydrolase [Georgenia sp. Marseille-Q6866]